MKVLVAVSWSETDGHYSILLLYRAVVVEGRHEGTGGWVVE